jgi:hypothetical protein
MSIIQRAFVSIKKDPPERRVERLHDAAKKKKLALNGLVTFEATDSDTTTSTIGSPYKPISVFVRLSGYSLYVKSS